MPQGSLMVMVIGRGAALTVSVSWVGDMPAANIAPLITTTSAPSGTPFAAAWLPGVMAEMLMGP